MTQRLLNDHGSIRPKSSALRQPKACTRHAGLHQVRRAVAIFALSRISGTRRSVDRPPGAQHHLGTLLRKHAGVASPIPLLAPVIKDNLA